MAVTISGNSPTFSVTTGYAGGTITSNTAITTTSGTSAAFSGIPSWVKRVTIILSGVSTNGSSTPWLIQIGPSGGVETTGYASSCSAVSSAGYNSTTNTSGFALGVDNSAAVTASGSVTITLVNSATNTWVASGVVAETERSLAMFTGGTKSISGTLSTIRLITSNGTDVFDAGYVNILYE